jgi:hypothetical protein
LNRLPPWDGRYPSADRIRAECDTMRECVLEALLGALGEDEFAGIYAHGSSLKKWDSPIDYVPEVSDVDVQLVLKRPEVLTEDLDRALAIAREYERRFGERCPDAVHLPRPQIQVINKELEIPEFLPSPPGTSRTLFGRDISEERPQPDPAFVAQVDRATLRKTDHVAWVADLPMWLIDRPGHYAYQALNAMAWRISPTGPRVLSLLGAGFDEAWGGNRTQIHQRLVERGHAEFAEDYAAFYLNAWQFFLSENQDIDAAHRALRAGARVIQQSHAIAMAAAD